MKHIAVCLSGQIRTWETCLPNLMRYFESHGNTQVDYFYHTWEEQEESTNRGIPLHERRHLSTVNEIDSINKILKPKKYKTTSMLEKQKYDTMDGKNSHMVTNDRWMHLFYSYAQSIHLKTEYELENNFTYDLVIKSRFDIIFDPAKEMLRDLLHLGNKLILYTAHCFTADFEFHRYNFNDVAFYGSSAAMNILALLPQYQNMIINERFLGTHERIIDMNGLGPGTLMYKFIMQRGIKIIDNLEIHEYIVRKNCNIDPNTPDGYKYYVDKHWEWYKLE